MTNIHSLETTSSPHEFDFATVSLAGVNLVEAGAGTGKTWSITGIYLRLLLEKKILPDKILVVTFTDAATSELRDRIRTRLAGALEVMRAENTAIQDQDAITEYLLRLRAADEDAAEYITLLEQALALFDEAPVHTIHGFCYRLIREHAFENSAPLSSELLTDVSDLARTSAFDFWRQHAFESPYELAAFLAGDGLDPDAISGLHSDYSSRLDLEIRPETAPLISPVDTLKELQSEYAKFRNEYKKEKDNFERWLSSSGFNGVKVKPGNIIAALNDLVEQENPLLLEEDMFARAGWTFLSVSLNKGKSTQAHSISLQIDSMRHKISRLAGWRTWLKAESLRSTREGLSRALRQRGKWSFDELLLKVADSVRGPFRETLTQVVRQKYHAALIDEFQDTDTLQCAIFSTLFADYESSGTFSTSGMPLFLIGDPKQSIYAFRGADINSYLFVRETVDTERLLVLRKNWRSANPMIQAINSLFDQPDPFYYGDQLPFVPATCAREKDGFQIDGHDGSGLISWIAPVTGNKSELLDLICRQTAGEISHLLESGLLDGHHLRAQDIAILVRSGSQAKQMQTTLQNCNIPSVCSSTTLISETTEAQDLELLLRAIETLREETICAVLPGPFFDFTASDIASLRANESDWITLLAEFHEYHELWNRLGFIHMFRAVRERRNLVSRLSSRAGCLRAITNFQHLAELLQTACVTRGLGPAAAITWLTGLRQGNNNGAQYEQRLETDENAVTIITVHKSKGLEYPVVFVPFAWDTPDSRHRHHKGNLFHENNSLVLDFDPVNEEHQASEARDEFRESLRLLYVALTRAKYRTYLPLAPYHGGAGGYAASAPAWLLHGSSYRYNRAEMIDQLATGIKEQGIEIITRALHEKIAAAPKGAISVIIPPTTFNTVPAAAPETMPLPCREMQRAVPDDWKISSFSYLVSGLQHEQAADFQRDEVTDDREMTEQPADAFPAGAQAGTCIHDIFERVDFNVSLTEISEQAAPSLAAAGIQKSHTAGAAQMVFNALNAAPGPLASPLCNISRSHTLRELEFYFPAAPVNVKGLHDVLDPDFMSDGFNLGINSQYLSLNFDVFQGYLKGFIDLVYLDGDRYYIIDWKTNRLGSESSAYTPERVCAEMDHHLYTLQGYIYSAALHLYLGQRVINYNYETHFGGIRYYFVRGMSHTAQPGHAVWNHRPQKKTIEALCAYLSRKGDRS